MNFTRIFSYFFTRMYPYVSRMLVVCYSYVSVCYSYVTLMYSCGVLVMIRANKENVRVGFGGKICNTKFFFNKRSLTLSPLFVFCVWNGLGSLNGSISSGLRSGRVRNFV